MCMAESRGRPPQYPEIHDEEMLREEYLENDTSISQIARDNGCSRCAVIYALDKYGLRDEKMLQA